MLYSEIMLLAYIDEFGHVGPYISPGHPKFKTYPIFRYSGFIVPAHNVRPLGAFLIYKGKVLLMRLINRVNTSSGGGEGVSPSDNKKYDGLRS